MTEDRPVVDDRYALLTRVGRGATGEVFKALDLTNRDIVAVKLVAEYLCAVDAAGQGDAALLLLHSRSLQRHVLRELCAELLGELGREAGVEWVREGVARLELRRGAVAIVASVDDLSGELVGGAALSLGDSVIVHGREGG